MKNVESVDLNLLIAFNAMFIERNVTRAGERIGLAQPSMSNSLARLRGLFDDELFVRSPEGMLPTPTALNIAEHVSEALLAAELAINLGRRFDPKSASADIKLLTNDYVELVYLPTIFKVLAKQAPGIRLSTRPMLPSQYTTSLDNGIADFAIAASSAPNEKFHYATLIDDTLVCIARRNHPIIGNAISLEKYLSCQHALMSPTGAGRGFIDDALETIGHTRRVAACVSSFNSLPHLVAGSDLVAVVPNRLALEAQRSLALNVFALPFDMPPFDVKLIWGRRTDRSPLHKWVRELIVANTSKSGDVERTGGSKSRQKPNR